MKIQPKKYQEAYGKQEERGNFEVPPTGTYLVVNTKLQHQKVGDKQTPKVQVFTHILEVVATDDPNELAEAKEWTGQEVQQSLWWDLTKKGNQERVACMGIACGQMDEWDPEDDKQLVKTITGVPYQIKARRKEEEYLGKKRLNFDVMATQAIAQDKRKQFASAPDWIKVIGDPSTRMMEAKAGKSGGGNAAAHSEGTSTNTKVQEVDPFADIPFSNGSSKG